MDNPLEKTDSEISSDKHPVVRSVDTVIGFLKDLLGGAMREAGGIIEDEVHVLRWANRRRIAHRAMKILEEDNIAARVLPHGFLLPLLEEAGNIDDPDLQEMWANLLASGVESELNTHPRFVKAMSQISKHDAEVLLRINKVINSGPEDQRDGHFSMNFLLSDSEEPADHLALENLTVLGFFAPATGAILGKGPWIVRTEFCEQFIKSVTRDHENG